MYWILENVSFLIERKIWGLNWPTEKDKRINMSVGREEKLWVNWNVLKGTGEKINHEEN